MQKSRLFLKLRQEFERQKFVGGSGFYFGISMHSPLHTFTKNPIYVFPDMKLRGLVPSSYIHVPASDLYIGMPIWLQQNSQTDHGNIQITHRYMTVEIASQNIIILFWNNEAAQFHF
jgi:hypothetical protein